MHENMEQKNSIIVGLTGQTGAGKTTVSEMLTDRGYRVIDADQVARQVVEKGNKCLLDLALEFGIGILDGEGNLNRRKLGRIVFQDKQKQVRLGEITFPYIQEAIKEQAHGYQKAGERVVFLDAPTLLESGSDSFCDKVVSVIAPEDMRLQRLLSRDMEYTREEIENRISSQHKDDYYTSRSDFVIRNDSSNTHLRVQIVEMLEVVCRGIAKPLPEKDRDS